MRDREEPGIGGMIDALRAGGTLLIANLTSFSTAGMPTGWTSDGDEPRFLIDHYLEERAVWVRWRGIRIRNWHRPLGAYMAALLGSGLELRHFSEPSPVDGDPRKAERYRRVPYFHIMESWEPAARRAGVRASRGGRRIGPGTAPGGAPG